MSFVPSLGLPSAALLIDLVSGAVALLVGFSGLFGGVAHYLAVLAGGSTRRVEVRTGLGFFAGVIIGILLLLSESFV